MTTSTMFKTMTQQMKAAAAKERQNVILFGLILDTRKA